MFELYEWFSGIKFSGAFVAGAGLTAAYAVSELWRDLSPRDETATAHGTARWARQSELPKLTLPERIYSLYVGRWPSFRGKPIAIATDRHLLTIASSRSGKGVSAIVPNLFYYPSSVVIVDPKGENFALTARRRAAMGHTVMALDPFGITGLVSASFNPLAELNPKSRSLLDECRRVAGAMMNKAESDTAQHFNEEAASLMTGLLEFMFATLPPTERHLIKLRELLTASPDEFDHILTSMNACGGTIARAANRLLQKDPRERASVLSTAQKHTNFLDSAMMADVLKRSDFEAIDLRHRNLTLYLILPAQHIPAYSPWLRLLISSMLSTLADRLTGPLFPVLFILDEFAALGRLEAIENAIGLMAGYGVQIWPFLQDISQLRDNYPTRWSSFLANAGVIQCFGTNDTATADIISERLGRRTVTVRSDSENRNAVGVSGGVNYGVISRPLLDPSEILALPNDEQILFVHGMRPIRARKLCYYKDREFKAYAPSYKKMTAHEAYDDIS